MASSRKTTRRRRREPEWAAWTDEEILDLRFRDLGVHIEGTWLHDMVARLYDEMEGRGLRFRPHVWLSTEWFSPDGVPGVAIPFYLAHPRLMRLEKNQVYEVEGGTRDWCMKILRHETGHAIDTAYRLRRRRRWQEVFGFSSQPYPDSYQPKPWSRHYVLHLDWWYAQSHPLEDFAETFAVWLKPESRWRKLYAGWPALKKLQYVHDQMAEIAREVPPVRNREVVEPLRLLRRTLRSHYKAKRSRQGVDLPDLYDRDLERLFAPGPATPRRKSAALFLRSMRPEIRSLVAHWTGQHAYMVDQFLREMIGRCRALKLRLARSEAQTRLDVAVHVTVQVMNYLRRGGFRIAL